MFDVGAGEGWSMEVDIHEFKSFVSMAASFS